MVLLVADLLDYQGGEERDGVPDGTLFTGWGHHCHVAKMLQFFTQGAQTRSVNAVVVGQQNPHTTLLENKKIITKTRKPKARKRQEKNKVKR